MPNDVRADKIEFGDKEMASILEAMKKEYLRRQDKSH